MIKYNFLYIVFTTVLLFLAQYTKWRIFYNIFYVLLSLPVVSLVFLVIMRFRYRCIEQITSQKVVRGEEIKYSLKIINRDGFLYPYIKIQFNQSPLSLKHGLENQAVYISPFKNLSIKREINCAHIGIWDIGVDNLEFRDFLKFFKIASPKKYKSFKVQVLPKIVYLKNFRMFNTAGEAYNQIYNKLGAEDYSEIEEIFQYHKGQPLKNIHWKLSAKKNELMSKKYSRFENRMTLMFLDISTFCERCNLEVRDIIIESGIAVLNYCLRYSIDINLYFNDHQHTNVLVRSKMDFENIYQKLINPDRKEYVPIETVLESLLRKNFNCKNIVVIMSNSNLTICSLLVALKRLGCNITFIYTATDKTSQEHKKSIDQLKNHGIYVYQIMHADEIKDVLEN